MTKSEYIRRKFVEPVAKMMEKMVHQEDRAALRVKLEIWFLRELTDLQNLSVSDIADLSERDFEKYGGNPLESD